MNKDASFLASISRALLIALGFFFRRPIRLFRPVKISSWLGLQAIAAERKQKPYDLRFLTGLIREEGWRFFPTHILPPLIINSIIGFSLFFSYTLTSNHLLPFLPPPSDSGSIMNMISLNSLALPFLSGGVAGMIQSIISTPLDNAKLILLQRQTYLRSLTSTTKSRTTTATVPYSTWRSLIDAIIHPLTPLSNPSSSATSPSRFSGTLKTRSQFRSAYNSFGLSMVKDSLSFAVFFTVFESGRAISRSLALKYDGLTEADLRITSLGEGSTSSSKKRSKLSLILQSLGILIFGGIAGWCVGFIGRPFDRIREIVWASRNLAGGKQELRRTGIANASNSTIMKRRITRERSRKLSGLSKAIERGWKVESEVVKQLLLPKLSTFQLVKQASQEIGYFRLLFSSTPSLHLPHSSTLLLRKKSSPTRLSHRYHINRRLNGGVVKRGRLVGGLRVLTYVPPYALGLLVYSLMMGDLS